MKINNNFYLNPPARNKQKEDLIKYKNNDEKNKIRANSLDAADNIGRAQVNMSFKSNSSFEHDLDAQNELTDEEYEKLHKEYIDKFCLLRIHCKKSITPFFLNKLTVKNAIKVLSNEHLYGNKDFMYAVENIFRRTRTSKEAELLSYLLDKISADEKLYKNEVFMKNAGKLISGIYNEDQLHLAEQILNDENLYSNEKFMSRAGDLLYHSINEEQIKFTAKILFDENLNQNEVFIQNAPNLIGSVKESNQAAVLNKIISDKRLYGNEAFIYNSVLLMNNTLNEEKADNEIKLLEEILSDEHLTKNDTFMKYAPGLIKNSETDEQIKLTKQIFSDKNLYANEHFMPYASGLIENAKTEAKIKFVIKILFDEKLNKNKKFLYSAYEILQNADNDEQIKLAAHICSDENLYTNKNFMNYAHYIIKEAKNKYQIKLAIKIMFDERLNNNEKFLYNAAEIIKHTTNSEKYENVKKILDDKNLPLEQASCIICSSDKVSYEKIKKFYKLLDNEKISRLSDTDRQIAVKYIDIFDKQNINEIPQKVKKRLLKDLISFNDNLFNLSGEIKQMFPLLPDNQEKYCRLLPAIVHSLGIETISLENDEINKFNKNINELALTLSKMTEDEFKKVNIKLEYDKNDFIKDILEKVKYLPYSEKQKIYDYFGFEIYKNQNASYKIKEGTGYSLTGYPINLNNREKLEQIKNPITRIAIEDIRNNVIKFSENNSILCSDKKIEHELNEIIRILPELRPSIGCIQAGMNNTSGAHQYDIFKHSLKVMQGIVKDSKYKSLNDTDKKIMLLASLMHDITKKEGVTDIEHSDNSSFDAYFISKKFKLTKEEEIKLFTLIKTHEWLGYVNRAGNKKELQKREQSIAYDLRHDNMFDMSLIFTHADLKGVNDEFHDIKNEKRISVVDGITRSYGEAADFYAIKIKEYIEELKKSQPLLPVTKFPKASTIEKSITDVYPDGSTNIKGIYKDKDGLVIIKYNELANEDLENIGFEKGSSVKGIKTKTSAEEDVNTGNVKFFAHGLEHPNQLVKFDAFSLIDSEVLLSVSYAERPESKFRFYRPQGILLDCDTKYIHGGGETDSGSGHGKHIKDFKNRYIFGGERTKDRTNISNLIKTTLNLDDKKYIKFIKDNENKSMAEIEPEEIRIKIIEAFSTINSNIRTGKREYNEMFISNPKPPMAVFAYAENYNEKISNPIEFLKKRIKGENETKPVKDRTEFLRKYALEKDLPFVIFGD